MRTAAFMRICLMTLVSLSILSMPKMKLHAESLVSRDSTCKRPSVSNPPLLPCMRSFRAISIRLTVVGVVADSPYCCIPRRIRATQQSYPVGYS